MVLMFPRRHLDDEDMKAPSIRKVADDMGEQVAAAVVEATDEGGQWLRFASPNDCVCW